MMAKRGSAKKVESEIAIIDFETDPFRFDRVPQPFACGVLWRGVYADFWGPECWREAADYLLSIRVPLIVYAHNGGKFDFFFMWRILENPIRLISSRIVSARLGIHELRDSWSILPFALARYKKTKIDYALFEPEVRDAHKTEILNYLHDDCTDLMELCSAFVGRFGPRLTIGGTAMRALCEIHPQENHSESHDKTFRPFYFGGRVECFQSGIIEGDWKIYDVNSMYPAVMANCEHPLGDEYVSKTNAELDENGWIVGYPGCMYFCEVSGANLGALPQRGVRALDGLRFDVEFGTFHTTSHELRAAIGLGKFSVACIHRAYLPRRRQRFVEFVDKFSAEKKSAKLAGDKIGEIFAKLILNSAYGKFGQNPEHFKEYYISIRGVTPTPGPGWDLEESADGWTIWSQPSTEKRYFDVAIAASVTGAARAALMLGIANATVPLYCDTDSIICQRLDGVKLDDYELGAWKLEATGTTAAIAGKKLYALFDGDEPVKWASKGTKLAPEAIMMIADGRQALWQSDAPNFSLSGKTKFISRVSRKTA